MEAAPRPRLAQAQRRRRRIPMAAATVAVIEAATAAAIEAATAAAVVEATGAAAEAAMGVAEEVASDAVLDWIAAKDFSRFAVDPDHDDFEPLALSRYIEEESLVV